MASIAECLAAIRFIPPPGAQQFEVTLMRRPETKPLEGTAVWVETCPAGAGELTRERFCQCSREWKLILNSLPEGDVKKYLREKVAEGAIITICECNGRILE